MSVPVLSWSFYAGSNQAPRAALRQRAGWIPRLEAAVSGRRQPGRLRSPASSSAAISGRSARGHSPPDPQSQSFSRSYGSILPTSLIYILLWTRGYTPWRPDAVMSTPGGAVYNPVLEFSRAVGGAPDTRKARVLYQRFRPISG